MLSLHDDTGSHLREPSVIQGRCPFCSAEHASQPPPPPPPPARPPRCRHARQYARLVACLERTIWRMLNFGQRTVKCTPLLQLSIRRPIPTVLLLVKRGLVQTAAVCSDTYLSFENRSANAQFWTANCKVHSLGSLPRLSTAVDLFYVHDCVLEVLGY